MADVPNAGTATLEPPPGIFVDSSTSPASFCFDTADWLQLQAYLVQALQLPTTETAFVARYGSFPDKSEIAAVVAAMAAVQALAADFGNPAVLMQELAKNPAIFQSTTPPAQPYTNLVWTAYRIYAAAVAFNQTLGTFKLLLEPASCGTPTECGQVLAGILTGTGGLQSTAAGEAAAVDPMVAAMSAFAIGLATANATLQQYSSSSSQFYKEAVAQHRQQLVADLDRLDSLIGNVGTAAPNFVGRLALVAAAGIAIGNDLAYIVTTYPPEQLGNYDWVNQTLKCEDAARDWQIIATAAQAYTSNALLPFPSPAPGPPPPANG